MFNIIRGTENKMMFEVEKPKFWWLHRLFKTKQFKFIDRLEIAINERFAVSIANEIRTVAWRTILEQHDGHSGTHTLQ